MPLQGNVALIPNMSPTSLLWPGMQAMAVVYTPTASPVGEHHHGLTVISRYTAPPGKAWKIIGKASALGREGYIMEGGYCNKTGRLIAGPGTFMFNAPGAIHGGISCHLTLYIHCCSGEPDEIVSLELIDFEPQD